MSLLYRTQRDHDNLGTVQNTKGLKNRFSVDLGTYWDGTEKQFSLTYPEDGTYLLYVRVHVVGANKMNAGSSVVLNGKGITATYPESIPLAKDWDRWRSAVFIVPTASGTYDYSLQGSFQGSRADANYGSSVTISIQFRIQFLNRTAIGAIFLRSLLQ